LEQLRASVSLDWLMLSVTLAEKCCGRIGLNIGSRKTPSLDEILNHLKQHLPHDIFSNLLAKPIRHQSSLK
jgi:hypothetical protein